MGMLTDQELKKFDDSFDEEMEMLHETKSALRQMTSAIDRCLETLATASGLCGPISLEARAQQFKDEATKLGRVCC